MLLQRCDNLLQSSSSIEEASSSGPPGDNENWSTEDEYEEDENDEVIHQAEFIQEKVYPAQTEANNNIQEEAAKETSKPLDELDSPATKRGKLSKTEKAIVLLQNQII